MGHAVTERRSGVGAGVVAPAGARRTALRVLVAGGGTAGIEAALALRSAAGDAVTVTVLEAGAAAAGLRGPARRAGCELIRDGLRAVEPHRRAVLTDGGRRLPYDRLVIAVGARREPGVAGALGVGSPADVPAYRALLARAMRAARRGQTTRIAFVVPAGCDRALPAYELALATGRRLARWGLVTRVPLTLVTAEARPLAVAGPAAGQALADELAAAGVTVVTGARVRDWAWGRLQLLPQGRLETDRVVALPVLRGPSVPGLPVDGRGFVRAGAGGCVEGLPDVYAVGGAGAPAPDGDIARRQARAVAARIAGGLSAGR